MSQEEGIKHDQKKLRYDLIPPEGIEALAKIYTFGAEKYTDRNWEKGIKFCRIFGAMMRHAWAWMRGERDDQESGLSHMAHVAWGCFALITYEERNMAEFDDRAHADCGCAHDQALASTMDSITSRFTRTV